MTDEPPYCTVYTVQCTVYTNVLYNHNRAVVI